MSNLTLLEKDYYAFRGADTHELVIYNPSGSAWYNRLRKNNIDKERISVLETAHRSLINSTNNKMKSERDYLALFNDLKTNESHWFNDILNNVYNFNLCDGIIVVLGTLASLKRNRNEIEIAREILLIDERVLNIYERVINTPGLVHSCCSSSFDTIKANLEGLKYKYSMIWVNFLPQLKSKSLVVHDTDYEKKLVSYYRQCMWYEIAYHKLSNEDIVFAIPLLMKLNRRPTLSDLKNTTDKELFAMLSEILKQNESEPEELRHLDDKLAKQATLVHCHHCKTQEQMRGDFKCCGQCKRVYYCSPECQKASWKDGHKNSCKEKSRA